MNAHADKASKNKGQAIANGLTSLKSESKSAFQFADNRPEAVAQRELQELANNSLQVSRLGFLQQLASNSPQGSQLRSLQQLANNSPQTKQVAQLRALANAKALSPIQEKIANGVAQLAQAPEEEELIQGKFETVQLQQNKSDSKPRENKTGLPDNLKAGIESLSGLSLDHVKVHYNSAQPAQLNALAYAQGSDIHLAPGQEQHLPHEAWHIVQQAQGRVQPTMQMKDGVPVNDDAGLEREADVMGGRAAQPTTGHKTQRKGKLAMEKHNSSPIAQLRCFSDALTDNKILPPRDYTEVSGGGTLATAVAGATEADLVTAKNTQESANIGKALNQAGDRFAEIGIKVNAILAGYGAGVFAPWNGGETANMLEPFIYRIKVPYKKGNKKNHIELDYQSATAFRGYIVRQKDSDDESTSFIHNAGTSNPTIKGQVNTFNMAHANTGDQALSNNLKQEDSKSKETNEARIDARTKLAGEGARWLLVRNNYTTIADDSRIWTQHKGKVYSVSFKTLWLSWAGVFGFDYNIEDAVVADKLVNDGNWADTPDVVKRNRWAAKKHDIEVHK
jgi:hypothetical protein